MDSASADKAVPETEDLQASVSDMARRPSEEQSKALEKPKQKYNHCFMYRKKVQLTGFQCWCGNAQWGVHRDSSVHSCSYKADAVEKTRKEHPVVVAEKIQRISTSAGIQNPLIICKLKIDLRFFPPGH